MQHLGLFDKWALFLPEISPFSDVTKANRCFLIFLGKLVEKFPLSTEVEDN